MNPIFDLTAMLHPDLYKRQAQMAQLRGGGEPLAGPTGLPFVEPTGAPQAAPMAPTPQPAPPTQPAAPIAAAGGLPRATGRAASPAPAPAPAAAPPATPFGGAAMGYMDKADEARRAAMEAMTPKPEELAAARKNALAQTVAGMGMALGGEEFAPMGQAMFAAAQKEFAEISPNPWKRAELASKKAEMEAAAWEKRAAMATSTEERRFALAQAAQQREADREMKMLLAGMAAGNRADSRQGAADQRLFQREQALAKDYEDATKTSRKEAAAAQRALALTSRPPNEMTAMDQMGLVYTVMKMFDPDSVVRESEYAMAQAAQGVPARLQNYLTQLQTGKRLNPQQVLQMKAIAENYAKLAGQSVAQQDEIFAGRARQWGVDPANIVRGGAGIGAPPAGGAPQRPRFERRGQGAQPGADGVNQLPY